MPWGTREVSVKDPFGNSADILDAGHLVTTKDDDGTKSRPGKHDEHDGTMTISSVRLPSACFAVRIMCWSVTRLTRRRTSITAGRRAVGSTSASAAEEALRRELREEIGAEIDDVRLMSVIENRFELEGNRDMKSCSSSRRVSRIGSSTNRRRFLCTTTHGEASSGGSSCRSSSVVSESCTLRAYSSCCASRADLTDRFLRVVALVAVS